MATYNGEARATMLEFTGFVQQDVQNRQALQNVKTVNLIDLTAQFGMLVYDTLPHPLYGDQTLSYFDSSYNLTNPSGDGKTWVCPGKMFTHSTSDLLYGSTHIDPAVYVDTTGGQTPQKTAMTSTDYTFDFVNGIVTLNTAVPTTSVVSLAGNPTYMAPEDMIRRLFTLYAFWSPSAITCDTSNVYLPQYNCNNQSLWTCAQQIAELTCPRMIPWTLRADENGFLYFQEQQVTGPATQFFIDERDFLQMQEVNDASQIQTVATANAQVALTENQDQPVESIAYDAWAVVKYGETQPSQIDSSLLQNIQNLNASAATCYMNMLTIAAVARSAQPVLTINVEVWPNPATEVGDVVKVYSKSEGFNRYFIVQGITTNVQAGQYQQNLRLQEYLDTINFVCGAPNTVVNPGNQPATSQPFEQILGAIRMGSDGQVWYPMMNSQYTRDQATGRAIVPVWQATAAGGMHFDVFLNSSGGNTADTPPGYEYNYEHLPSGYTWEPRLDSDGVTREYAYDGTYTYCVGPDNVFYKWTGTNSATQGELVPTNIWYPTGNTVPTALGGAQPYNGSANTVYLWSWWYLCLDTDAGTGSQYRYVQRVNPTQDAQANNVPATGGLWVNNLWTGPAGPNTQSVYYGNMAVGVTNYMYAPSGFVGAPIFTDGTSYGVAYGSAVEPASEHYYVGYEKETRGHFCVLAANGQGGTQFVRIPFTLLL